MIPERGLSTGVAILGAVGSGKTSACMHPVARQLLGWQADNPARRPAALVLEVKGDLCHDIRAAGRAQPAPRHPRAGHVQNRHRQEHGRIPYHALQLHELQRDQAEPLACISTRIVSASHAPRSFAGSPVAATSPTCELLSVSGPEAITASTETFTAHIFSRARVATTSPSLRKPRARLPHSVNVPKRTFTPFRLLRLQNPQQRPANGASSNEQPSEPARIIDVERQKYLTPNRYPLLIRSGEGTRVARPQAPPADADRLGQRCSTPLRLLRR